MDRRENLREDLNSNVGEYCFTFTYMHLIVVLLKTLFIVSISLFDKTIKLLKKLKVQAEFLNNLFFQKARFKMIKFEMGVTVSFM